MSSRVGVCLVAAVSIEVGSGLEESGSESHRLLVRNSGIVDVEIEVYLLRAAVRPVRGTVVRCELHADPPFAGGVRDAVPTVVLEDAPAKDSGPERALRVQVRCVEHDDLTHHSHDRIIDFPNGSPGGPLMAQSWESAREYPRATLNSLITRAARLVDDGSGCSSAGTRAR